jgi:hypothetical protein
LTCGYSLGQQLDIKIVIDTCIDARLQNKVEFVIENHSTYDYWIKNEFLPFYFSIYTPDGELVGRKTTRHLNSIGNTEYTKIDKNSRVIVHWVADFFDNYDFQINKKYYIKTCYEYPFLTREEKKKSKNSDFKLIQSKNYAKSNIFRICRL